MGHANEAYTVCECCRFAGVGFGRGGSPASGGDKALAANA
eukprot:gene7803-1359_t